MKKYIYIILICWWSTSNAQELTISGEIRPRTEHKNYLAGHTTLKPIWIATQRTRLRMDYNNKQKRFATRITFQDARVMGNTDQQSTGNNNTLGLYEGWAEIFFMEKISLRIGRQEIYYDDERILGQSNFGQAGRSHDAVLLRYRNKWKIDIGGAIHNNTSKLSQSYEIPYGLNNYKNMQLFHAERQWEKLRIGMLFFNNGIEYTQAADPNNANSQEEQEVIYNQTFGADIKWKLSKNITFRNIGYHQMGYDHEKRKVNAYNIKSTVEWRTTNKKLGITAGVDYFSGNPQGASPDENRSFTTLYGAALLHLGMAGIYLLPYKQGQFSYNNGVVKYLAEVKWRYNKWIIWNRLYAYNSEHSLPKIQGQQLDKFLGIEEELFLIYRFNKNITFQGIIGLFNMSDNTKQGLGYNTFNDWQQWYIFEVSIRPTFFRKLWKK